MLLPQRPATSPHSASALSSQKSSGVTARVAPPPPHPINAIAKNSGDMCSDAGAICNPGSICKKDEASAFFKCVAKGGVTEACDSDTNPCIEALRCTEGKCAARAMSGEACMSNDDCATAVPFCDDSIGNKCDQGLNLGPGSAACAKFGGA